MSLHLSKNREVCHRSLNAMHPWFYPNLNCYTAPSLHCCGLSIPLIIQKRTRLSVVRAQPAPPDRSGLAHLPAKFTIGPGLRSEMRSHQNDGHSRDRIAHGLGHHVRAPGRQRRL